MRSRSVLAVVCGVFCAVLGGCGSSPTSPGVAQPLIGTSNIAGNWLLAGSLPEGPFPPATSTQLTLTFANVGDQLVGTGEAAVACSSVPGGGLTPISIDFGFTVSGQVASNGTFVAQSVPNTSDLPIPTIKISGIIPASPAGAWSGSYTINTQQAQTNCPAQVSDDFSASAIGPVTGTYVATGVITDSSSQTPITVTMTLEQGLTSTVNGVSVDQAYALNGTIAVDGTPCFHTGTLQRAAPEAGTGFPGLAGSVFGGAAFPAFSMDDGSLLIANVYIANTAASELDAEALGVSSGNCMSTTARQIQMGNFTRQN